MSYMSDLDLVRQEMERDLASVTPVNSDPVGQALHSAFERVDDLIILANRPDTREQVLAEKIALSQLFTRMQLLVSFVQAAEHPKLKVVGRG